MKKSLFSLAFVALTTFQYSCAATTDDSDERIKGINGTMLHRIHVGPSHRIEFFQFDTGITAVRETMSVDSGERPLVDSIKHSVPFSLGEVFRQLSPREMVPHTLLRADAESEMITNDVKSYKDWPKPSLLTDSFGPNETSSSPASRSSTASTMSAASAAAQSCSSDYYGDNWGQDWFKQNYCNTGQAKTCWFNVGWGYSTRSNFKWYSYRQMEGDFNIAGHASVSYWLCTGNFITGSSCGWTPIADEDVAPRTITIWTFGKDWSDGVHAAGTSPCGHLDMATLYNSK